MAVGVLQMASRILLLIVVVSVTWGYRTQSVIRTSTGAIQGSSRTVLGKEVLVYMGIPFAQPPTGDLRFKRPEPVNPWKGVYEATDSPAPCVQYSALNTSSEDCLYLNLWVSPRDGQDEPLKPIMVWIYGGGFTDGSSALDYYNGEVLAAYGDVIVASMNYRLGIFGFLYAEVEEAPGNMGMWDQVLAMRWIKTNAKRFGGDPDRITLFGESSGSNAVGFHLLSPVSQGLFNRIIMQSATPYQPVWDLVNSTAWIARGDRVARAVDCSNDERSLSSDPQEVLRCLREKDPILLAEAERTVFGFNSSFYPQVGDEIIPYSPTAMIRDGNFNPTNILTGVTVNEGAFFLYASDSSFFTENKWTVENARIFIERFCADWSIPNCDRVLDYYLGGLSDGNDLAIAKALFDVQGDYIIMCTEVFFAESVSKVPGGTIYFYVMDHQPSNSFYEPWVNMTHFEDVPFVFGQPLRTGNTTQLDVDFSKFVMDKWIAFAKTGNPNTPGSVVWPKFTAKDRAYLHMRAENQEVRRGLPFDDNCQFWRPFFG